MSHFKLKQIAGPTNGAKGGIIVFDNTIPKWSTDLTTSLTLPSGNTAARPQPAANGSIRYNTQTNHVEALENGTWVALAGPSTFATLTDGPGTLEGQAGKAVRVKSDTSGLEYYIPSTGLTKFRFKVLLTDQNPTSVDELPSGWSVQITTTTLKVTHNLGVIPAFVSTFGKYSLAANEYIHRITGAGAAAAVSLRYDITDLSFCYVASLTANSTGAQTGTHVYVDMYFLLN
jgi:hypothetical protein